jgi:subtilase family serine protease
VTAVGGTSAAIIPASATIADNVVTGTALSPKDAPALYGNTNADDGALTAATNWKRGFEVGWQTGLTSISPTAAISPTDSYEPTYLLDGAQASKTTFNGGAGGGVSRVFAEPAYQQAAKITASGRAVPDIAALADPNTGFLVGQTQQFGSTSYYDEYRLGGTSLAAPLMAGIAAVANQHAGGPLGFLNPLIYQAYDQGAGSSTEPSVAASTSALYDVDQADLGSVPAVIRVNYVNNLDTSGGLSYSVRTLEADQLTSLDTGRGYDGSTGVGTPNGDTFLKAIAGS